MDIHFDFPTTIHFQIIEVVHRSSFAIYSLPFYDYYSKAALLKITFFLDLYRFTPHFYSAYSAYGTIQNNELCKNTATWINYTNVCFQGILTTTEKR